MALEITQQKALGYFQRHLPGCARWILFKKFRGAPAEGTAVFCRRFAGT
jgi:hypothetical protein